MLCYRSFIKNKSTRNHIRFRRFPYKIIVVLNDVHEFMYLFHISGRETIVWLFNHILETLSFFLYDAGFEHPIKVEQPKLFTNVDSMTSENNALLLLCS